MSSRSDTSYPLVSVSCATTLQSTSLISIVPCWLGVMGTRGNWLSKNSCLWDSNKEQAASEISTELIVKFLSKSFTLKTSESGPKSKIHCVPLLETVNCIVLIVKELRVVSCRKVWKMKRKMNLCCNKTVQSSTWFLILKGKRSTWVQALRC